MAQAHIGISGWRYTPWRGTFYPTDLAQKNELPYASRQVNSIEINGSFYSLQRPTSYQAWYDATPEGFVFSLKGSRFITHMRRLRNVKMPLANFLASGMLALKEKLGPFLWQFPPNFKFDEKRLADFFELLPRDMKSAAKMGSKHDRRIKGGAYLRVDENRPLRHAIEIRHDSFKTPAFVKLLRKHDIAMCVADTAGTWPLMEDVTSDFVYVRLHGEEQIYVSGYTDEALDHWAGRVKASLKGGEVADAKRVGAKAKSMRGGRDVYVYFDNDVKVMAPRDARGLMRRVGLAVPESSTDGKRWKMDEEARDAWPAVHGQRSSPCRVS